MPRNYYDILGISPDSSSEEIVSAYRSLAKAFHPDISTHPNAGPLFLNITKAYEILSDPKVRRDYDRSLNRKSGAGKDAVDNDNRSGNGSSCGNSGSNPSDDNCGFKGGKDEFSVMADYEYYSEKPEKFLIDGEEVEISNARHIITGDHDYIVYNDTLIDTGGILRFRYDGNERFLIDGAETIVKDAEHYIQGGCEYVVISGKSYLIRKV